MRLIITHFYNEEYLLPWWLEHHKKYFDHGLLIDYASTDRSVEICKDICPTWDVFPSKFRDFDAHHLEYEVMFIERQIPNYQWRIAIPCTEFVVGDLDSLTPEIKERKQWVIPSVVFAEYAPNRTLDKNKKLWEQCYTGVHYQDLNRRHCWTGRSLHNYNDMFYLPGRHFEPENTDKAMIFKYSNLLVGPEMINRKLQVQTKISTYDRLTGNALTHRGLENQELTLNNLEQNHKELIGDTYDCTEMMNRVLKYL